MLNDTCDGYYPKVGVVGQDEDVLCGVCETKMNVRRNQVPWHSRCGLGSSMNPDGVKWRNAVGDEVGSRDLFDCPHKDEEWHQRVISLRKWRDACPLSVMKEMCDDEANELVKSRSITKTDSGYQGILTTEEYQNALDKLDKLMVPNPDGWASIKIEQLTSLIEEYEALKEKEQEAIEKEYDDPEWKPMSGLEFMD
jgi:hypothetical protein